MKKIITMFFVAVAALTLAACGKKEFKFDGKFMALEEGLNYGSPMVTSVEVTIENGKIKGFNIDAVQSVKGEDGKFVWNAKSKKELGYLYAMHNKTDAEQEYEKQDLSTTEGLAAYKAYLKATGKQEWFEQANVIEAKWLADGVNSITVGEDGKLEGVSTVTITDGGYVALAKKAVENAKAGIYTAYETGDNYGVPMLTWVEVTYKDGKATKYNIDALQATVTEGAFAWNAKSKKELGYLYAMHNKNDAEQEYEKQDLSTTEGLAAYKEYLKTAGKLEWFEQANVIEAKWLSDGVNSITVGVGGKLEGVSTVTITDGGYVGLAKAAVAKVK